MSRHSRIALCLLEVACLAAPGLAWCQAFPTRTVRIVVPFPPGAGLDVMSRMAAQRMSEQYGQPVVVENRAGANGAIGAELARSAPDGHTLLAGTSSTHVSAIYITPNLPYDPVKDFTPITAAVGPVVVLAAHPSVPANSIKELIDYARRNPGKLSYGSSGTGGAMHLTGELFKQTAGVDVLHVPYKGLSDAMKDLIGGQVSLSFTGVTDSAANMRAGKVKILAVVEPTRFPGLPEVPSLNESLPGFERPQGWFGFFGPAGLPRPVTLRLNDGFVKALTAPEIRRKLEATGLAIIASTPDQFDALLKQSIATWGRAIKAAGIKSQ